MARICEKCGKGPTSGATRSHSNIKTKRIVLPNLQMKKVDGQRLRLCTTCIKSLSKKVK